MNKSVSLIRVPKEFGHLGEGTSGVAPCQRHLDVDSFKSRSTGRQTVWSNSSEFKQSRV